MSPARRFANCPTINPIRRELLNGLLVLVIASLLSVAFSAFQVSFNAPLWVLILTDIAIASGFYIVFELTLGFIAASDEREKDWLKRVGDCVVDTDVDVSLGIGCLDCCGLGTVERGGRRGAVAAVYAGGIERLDP